MPNPTVINNYADDQIITLGDVAKDQVNDYSAGGNTITLGNGAGDSVYSNAPYDSIFLGNGKADSVFLDKGTYFSDVTLGNGNLDSVTDNGFGFSLISLGNGAGDTVSANTLLGDEIAVGWGAKDVVTAFGGADGYFIETGAGSGDVVRLDTGAPVGIGGQDGASEVFFGGPNATLDLTYVVGPSSLAAPLTYRLDIISGLVKGDHIILSGGSANTDTVASSASLGGVAGEAVLTPGTYDSGAHMFTAGAGPDALLTYDTQGANGGSGYVSVVLVGAAHEIAGSTIHAGTITLG